MKKLLSIIIPVYNVEKYIRKCLESILTNKSNTFEIILIDDGSTDDSGLICDEYSKKYSNVIVLHKENGGASDARNYGTKKANGEYIWYIDSDDYITEGSINSINNILSTYESDVIVCQSKKIYEDNHIVDECQYSIEEGCYSSREFMKVLRDNPKSVIFCPQYYIVKREFINKYKIFFHKGIIYEDELWIPQLLINAENIYYSGLNIYFHVMRKQSVMHSTKLEKCGYSAYVVATELYEIFEKSKRTDLQFLRDRCTNIFLQAVWKKENFLKEKKKYFRYRTIKNSLYYRTKLKALLYFMSPKLYISVHKVVKK